LNTLSMRKLKRFKTAAKREVAKIKTFYGDFKNFPFFIFQERYPTVYFSEKTH
jgi:hypothetical protein